MENYNDLSTRFVTSSTLAKVEKITLINSNDEISSFVAPRAMNRKFNTKLNEDVVHGVVCIGKY